MLYRYLFWSAIVLIPLLMVIFLLPLGFPGVTYSTLAFIVLMAIFIAMSLVESNVLINCLVVVTFYIAILIWHILDHGVAPGGSVRLLKGSLYIGIVFSSHVIIQAVMCYFFRHLRRDVKG